MRTKEILTRAKEIITDPKRWAKGYYAFNKHQQAVASSSPRAVCWCALGAIRKAVEDVTGAATCTTVFNTELADATLHMYNNLDQDRFCNISKFNDTPETTHEQILEFFDKAIQSCPNS